MASRGRYISHKDFGVLIADLHLASTIFQDRLLEFLERERIVLPITRVRWPTALVIEARGGIPATPATVAARTASEELAKALRLWNRFDADPEADHPLDVQQHARAGLVESRLAECPFEPWETYPTNIRGEGEDPLLVADAVDTFYHDWQVLLVADALDMGMRLLFDTRRQDLMNLALSGDFRDLPDDVTWQEVSFQGPRGLNQGLQWSHLLDAAARVEVQRTRKLASISRHHQAGSYLTESDLDDLNAAQRKVAKQAIADIQATPQQIIAFFTYLCERWNDWTHRGRPEVAAEYKRQIALGVRMVQHAEGRDFSSLATEIGRVTGHFENTLDVIFPDWRKDAREQVELSLKHSVVAKAPSADSALTLTTADIPDVLDWLERKGSWKIHLSIEAILARQFSGSPIDLAALAKEVESISTTFEHVVNALLEEALGSIPSDTLMKKVARFWSSQSDVHVILANEYKLVSTRTRTRAAQIARINALNPTGPNTDVARMLLTAVLYRNDGQHNAMASWAETELHEATRIFLTAIMFCRKGLLANPPQLMASPALDPRSHPR